MNELDVLPKTCVQIYQSSEFNESDVYHGSGVLVKINNLFYVITAAHVFSQDLTQPIGLQKFYGKSEEYGRVEFDSFRGTQNANNEYDIAVISIDERYKFPNFPNVKFCEDITFPGILLVFRGTQKSSALSPHTINPCSVDTTTNSEGLFCLKVPHDAYTDFKGNVGAEVLDGYSGSGIFIKGTDDIYLVGIAQNVGKDSFTGVNCLSIRVVKDSFIPETVISDFHGGNTQLKLNIARIRKNVTQTMIEERKSNKYGDIENLTLKMDSFIEDWTEEDLDVLIKNILIWKNIDHTKIRNNSLYRDPIDNAKAIWASRIRKYHVSSIQKGNECFHKILDELTEIIKNELEGTSIISSSPVIAAGEVARLLAICNLDIKK